MVTASAGSGAAAMLSVADIWPACDGDARGCRALTACDCNVCAGLCLSAVTPRDLLVIATPVLCLSVKRSRALTCLWLQRLCCGASVTRSRPIPLQEKASSAPNAQTTAKAADLAAAAAAATNAAASGAAATSTAATAEAAAAAASVSAAEGQPQVDGVHGLNMLFARAGFEMLRSQAAEVRGDMQCMRSMPVAWVQVHGVLGAGQAACMCQLIMLCLQNVQAWSPCIACGINRSLSNVLTPHAKAWALPTGRALRQYFFSTPALQAAFRAWLQHKLDDLRRPAYLHSLRLVGLDMGTMLPLVRSVRAAPTPGNTIWPQVRQAGLVQCESRLCAPWFWFWAPCSCTPCAPGRHHLAVSLRTAVAVRCAVRGVQIHRPACVVSGSVPAYNCHLPAVPVTPCAVADSCDSSMTGAVSDVITPLYTLCSCSWIWCTRDGWPSPLRRAWTCTARPSGPTPGAHRRRCCRTQVALTLLRPPLPRQCPRVAQVICCCLRAGMSNDE